MKQIKYRIIAFFLALALTLPLLSGCGSTSSSETKEAGHTVEFTDSLGRTVEVPETITQIAVTGPLAQIVVFAIAPDKLVAVSSDWPEDAADYIDEKYYNLPTLGQLYGGKGDLNKEELLKSGAQVVIDVGEEKDDMTDDFDALTKETGIPFVHISGSLSTMGDAYRMLGKLLGMKSEGEKLANYCEETYAKVVNIANVVGDRKVRALYCLGDFGENVIAKGSYHAEVLDLLTDNVAVVDNPSSKGTGTEVDMEQIMVWDPDVVIFAPNSIYEMAAKDEQWENIRAVQNGDYYEVPFGPYNWMGSPPSVQRYLGMLWLAKLLYPEQADYDLYSACHTYFELFYHAELSQDQYEKLVKNSIGML